MHRYNPFAPYLMSLSECLAYFIRFAQAFDILHVHKMIDVNAFNPERFR